MKHIGLTQRVEHFKEIGERRDALDQAWTPLMVNAGFLPVPLSNCIEDIENYLEKLQIKGVILTGGNDINTLPTASNTAPERDHFEHKLIDIATRKKNPLLGVCRGLQILILHYGGILTMVNNHVATTHRLIVKTSDSINRTLKERPLVNSFHQYGMKVDDIPKELSIIATADDNTVEAICHKKYTQHGIMWHPERYPHDERDVSLIKEIFT